jgi:hypothetical protein
MAKDILERKIEQENERKKYELEVAIDRFNLELNHQTEQKKQADKMAKKAAKARAKLIRTFNYAMETGDYIPLAVALNRPLSLLTGHDYISEFPIGRLEVPEQWQPKSGNQDSVSDSFADELDNGVNAD